jgi:dihydrofolate reductase
VLRGLVHGRRREPHREGQVWSSTLTASLLEQRLVDEIRVMVNPVLPGGGKSLFSGLRDRIPLRLARTTVFTSGNVLLTFAGQVIRRSNG